MEAWIVWIIIAASLAILEVITQMMWALCLAVGAAGALIASLCGAGIDWQLIILLIMAAAAYVILLPYFKRHHSKASERIARTGMDALLGRHAIVTHCIKPGKLGRARIDGDNWQVKAPDVIVDIPAGAEVVVTAYDSIILTVQPL